MAIGTSGYIEAVHLQQAPLKPDSAAQAAKMLQSVANLASAGFKLYNELNAPTAEDLTNLSQAFDEGIGALSVEYANDPDGMKLAVQNYQDNFNEYLDGLGHQHKTQLQPYIRNTVDPYYKAPYDIANQLAVQEDHLTKQGEWKDIYNSIIANADLNDSQKATELSKAETAFTKLLSPSQRLALGADISKMVEGVSTQAAINKNAVDQSNADAKNLYRYNNSVNQVNNNILARNLAAPEAAQEFKKFGDNLLKEVERDNPRLLETVTSLVSKQSMMYDTSAAKEAQQVDLNLTVGGLAQEWRLGKKSLQQVLDSLSHRADKKDALGMILNHTATFYKDELTTASVTNNPEAFKIAQSKFDLLYNDVRNELLLGRNNNAEAVAQFQKFETDITNIQEAEKIAFEKRLTGEAVSYLNNGNFVKAAEGVKKLEQAGYSEEASNLFSKINTAQKATVQFQGVVSAGLFNPHKATSLLKGKGIDAQVKARATEMFSTIINGHIGFINDKTLAPEVRQQHVEDLQTILANKMNELGDVRSYYQNQVDSMQSIGQLQSYATLVDQINVHSASSLLGKEQTEEILLLSTLAPVFENLPQGKEVTHLRNAIATAKNLDIDKESSDRANTILNNKAYEFPLFEDRDRFVKAVRMASKLQNVADTDAFSEKLYNKMMDAYMPLGDTYVVGAPFVALKPEGYYDAAAKFVVNKEINPQFIATEDYDSLLGNHTVRALPNGDVAFVPKIDMNINSGNSIIVSKEEIIEQIKKNYTVDDDLNLLKQAYGSENWTENNPNPASRFNEEARTRQKLENTEGAKLYKNIKDQPVLGAPVRIGEGAYESAGEGFDAAGNWIGDKSSKLIDNTLRNIEIGKKLILPNSLEDIKQKGGEVSEKIYKFINDSLFGTDEEVQP